MFKNRFDENIKRKKKQLPGQHSFVANGAYHEYELDLFFINHISNEEYGAAIILHSRT